MPRVQGRSVVSRVRAILEAFGPAHTRLTLSEIARRSELPLSTAHRLVAELVEWRALDRDPEGGYRIGLRLWELAQLAPTPLREVAQPWLQDLLDATRENVHLAIRDDMDVLYLDKISGPGAVQIASRVGGRLPMHATGVGKVLLAHTPNWYLRQYLDQPLERPTCYTITEPGRLARELAEVRARGWAVTREEMTLGSCSLAIPVRHRDGRVVAAVGVVVSSRRGHEILRFVPAVQTAAGRIEHALAERDDSVPAAAFPMVASL
jgi:DNA-binding IclR family transcriptional regulator